MWLPPVAGVAIAAAVAWLPYHTALGAYCGTSVGAEFKNPQPVPSGAPPGEVSARIARDEAAVASAQKAVNARQQSDPPVAPEQGNADSLAAEAQQATTKVSDLEAAVSHDRVSVSDGQAGVVTGKATVRSDAQAVAGDESAVQSDEQTLASDQTEDNYPGADEAQLQQDQQTLAHDQATLAKDQHALASDEAVLNEADAQMQTESRALSAAQQTAQRINTQARAAQNAAQSATSTTVPGAEPAEASLAAAEKQFTSDQQAWAAEYKAELSSANAYDAALSKCQGQANDHAIYAGAIGGLGLLLGALVYFGRRRAPPLDVT